MPNFVEGRSDITARGILARTGGSPNGIVKHWQRWHQEQEEIALAAVDEESAQMALWRLRAPKTSRQLKQTWTDKIAASEQQLAEMQTLLNQTEMEKEKLVLELNKTQAQITEQDKRQAVADLRLTDAESRNKELEKSYREVLLAHERAQTEKMMIEQQKISLEKRLENLERELKEWQASKHQCDLEITKLTSIKL